jgi:ubiquinone/menaquinone biosynthesis C-methylase UbiE
MATLLERLSAAAYDPFLWLGERRGMAEHRRRLLASARGRVLEIGAGTGLNLRHYSDQVEELVLTEPMDGMADRLERRVAVGTRPARVERAQAESLPFPDGTFDTVVSTLVLCTVEDPGRALAEIIRVLRPGGRLLFIEHLRSEHRRWARWQDRLEAPWAAFAEGCRCNRRTLELIEGSPLSLDDVEREAWRGMPRLVRPLAIGRARA